MQSDSKFIKPLPEGYRIYLRLGYNGTFHSRPYSGDYDNMTDTVRIDKWLWAARFFKTRTLASDAVDAGKVRLNGDRIKPARGVKPGDRLDIDNGATVWEVSVLGLSDKRAAAPIAQALYAETEASVAKRQSEAEQRRFFNEPSAMLKGRPTKRDRRLLDKSKI